MPRDSLMTAHDTSAAQSTVESLLSGAYIRSIAVRAMQPVLLFENASDIQSELTIKGEVRDWRVSPAQTLPDRLTDEQIEVLELRRLHELTVRSAECLNDGGLTVEFEEGITLTINGRPRDPQFLEPWGLIEFGGLEKRRIVALSGAGFAVWDEEGKTVKS